MRVVRTLIIRVSIPPEFTSLSIEANIKRGFEQYVGKCYNKCYIVGLRGVIRHGFQTVDKNEINGASYVDAELEIDAIVYNFGEVITGSVSQIDNTITCLKNEEDHTFIFVKNETLGITVVIGDIVAIRVYDAEYPPFKPNIVVNGSAKIRVETANYYWRIGDDTRINRDANAALINMCKILEEVNDFDSTNKSERQFLDWVFSVYADATPREKILHFSAQNPYQLVCISTNAPDSYEESNTSSTHVMAQDGPIVFTNMLSYYYTYLTSRYILQKKFIEPGKLHETTLWRRYQTEYSQQKRA